MTSLAPSSYWVILSSQYEEGARDVKIIRVIMVKRWYLSIQYGVYFPSILILGVELAFRLIQLMLVTDIGKSLCWWQIWDNEDRFNSWSSHQHWIGSLESKFGSLETKFRWARVSKNIVRGGPYFCSRKVFIESKLEQNRKFEPLKSGPKSDLESKFWTRDH